MLMDTKSSTMVELCPKPWQGIWRKQKCFFQRAALHGQDAPNKYSLRWIWGDLLLQWPFVILFQASHRAGNGVTDIIRAQRRWEVSKASSERRIRQEGRNRKLRCRTWLSLFFSRFTSMLCFSWRPPFLTLASDWKQRAGGACLGAHRCHWVLNTTQSKNTRV